MAKKKRSQNTTKAANQEFPDLDRILAESSTVAVALDGSSPAIIAPPKIAFADARTNASVVLGNCHVVMGRLCAHYPSGLFDVIFADPPYFLSNGGVTCQAGRMVKVDKGKWDKSQGLKLNYEFNHSWLSLCQSLLKPNGTIWITSTHHALFSLGSALEDLGFKILNLITWEKPNPPPNLSCRFFTHSTEMVIWAAKDKKSKHHFSYADMKAANGGKQMKTVWRFGAPPPSEKLFGHHPTQKPIALLKRCIEASSKVGDCVLDPFCGSGTTGVAALELQRKFIGIDQSPDFCALAGERMKSAIANGPTFV